MRGIHAGRFLKLACAGAALLLLAACASAPVVNRTNTLAQAGIAYSDAVPGALDESLDALVEADSAVLEQVRTDLASGQRLSAIQKSDEILDRRLEILRDLKRHAGLLRAYFVALRDLSETDAGPAIGAGAGQIASELSALSPRIGAASLPGFGLAADQPIGDLVAPAAQVAVAVFQNAALNAEFQARAATIERELALQEAALQAVAEATRSYLERTAEDRTTRIIEAYIDDAPGLPESWRDWRRRALVYTVQVPAADAAAKAARKLREAYIALAGNTLEDRSLGALIRDVQELVALVRAVRRGAS